MVSKASIVSAERTLMIAKSDRKNLIILEELACLRAVSCVFYREIMFDDALKPGYPDESAEKAILGLLANEQGIDKLYEDTREQIDAKVFIMLPLVFGVHKVGLRSLCKILHILNGPKLYSTPSSTDHGYTETFLSRRSRAQRKRCDCFVGPTRSWTSLPPSPRRCS